MTKKLIVVTAAVGLVSFAGAFVLAWFSREAPVTGVEEPNQPVPSAQEIELKLPRPPGDTMTAFASDENVMARAMTEKQLKYLVYEVQEKMQEYNNKLQGLESRERRLQVAHDALKKDIENLNNLRIELVTAVAALKDERDKLLKSRVEVAQAEKANLAKIAATYDKMDSASASKILTSMCSRPTPSGGSADSDSKMDDAVKILHYMTERTKAQVLAQLVTTEPKLAASLCERLKQVVEKQ